MENVSLVKLIEGWVGKCCLRRSVQPAKKPFCVLKSNSNLEAE